MKNIINWLSNIPYRIRSFFIRFRRAINWFFFIFKQPPWQEYESFIEIICKRLRDMADSFEKNPITTTSLQDAKDMRKVICLLKMGVDEYYHNKYYDEGTKEQPDLWKLEWKEGYNTDDWFKAADKDQKALEIAFKMMSYKLRGWWQ